MRLVRVRWVVNGYKSDGTEFVFSVHNTQEEAEDAEFEANLQAVNLGIKTRYLMSAVRETVE